MAEDKKKDAAAPEEAAEGAKPETKEEKKARKAKEKADKKAAKAAAKAAKKGGAAPEGEGAEGEDKKDAAPAKEGEAGAEGAEGTAAAPKSKKKLIIIIAAAVLLLGGGGAGLFLSGILGGGEEKKEGEVDPLLKEQTLYHDMDELLVNLNNPGNQVSFLKAAITLELPNQLSLNEVQDKMPKIRDLFQVYLRELRSSDLQGSAGLQRLRTELLLRINSVMEKGKVNNILFKEIIVQ